MTFFRITKWFWLPLFLCCAVSWLFSMVLFSPVGNWESDADVVFDCIFHLWIFQYPKYDRKHASVETNKPEQICGAQLSQPWIFYVNHRSGDQGGKSLFYLYYRSSVPLCKLNFQWTSLIPVNQLDNIVQRELCDFGSVQCIHPSFEHP